jgi:hypothetical protein
LGTWTIREATEADAESMLEYAMELFNEPGLDLPIAPGEFRLAGTTIVSGGYQLPYPGAGPFNPEYVYSQTVDPATNTYTVLVNLPNAGGITGTNGEYVYAYCLQ